MKMVLTAALTLALGGAGFQADDAVTHRYDRADDGPVRKARASRSRRARNSTSPSYMAITVAGKKINFELKDDTGAADVTKRLAQELVANDHAVGADGFWPHSAGAGRRAGRNRSERRPRSSLQRRPRR